MTENDSCQWLLPSSELLRKLSWKLSEMRSVLLSHCRSPGWPWCGILELFVVCLNYYATQYRTVQYSAVQYRTVEFSLVQYHLLLPPSPRLRSERATASSKRRGSKNKKTSSQLKVISRRNTFTIYFRGWVPYQNHRNHPDVKHVRMQFTLYVCMCD